ncbi:hypothetical protein ACTMTI_52340 [Nonomuraea sp. H19]|uniref:hypothetical protein n=1 Tax=Nonomuraea sp. H19 TaxID=3452206 RepID=UPI003F8B1466
MRIEATENKHKSVHRHSSPPIAIRGIGMLILAMKEGHDGGIVAIEDGKLLFALEAEKDNFPRYDRLTAEVITRGLGLLDRQPDVVALGG